jgi:dimethylamine/trimethylamine dehydrogenase
MAPILAESIFSGHRLGREIDSTNPDRPLPFIRERRLLSASNDDYVLGSPVLEPGWSSASTRARSVENL